MTPSFTTVASLVIFSLTYVLISVQKIRFLNLDRASAALLGALLMVGCGVLSLEDAYRAVSHDTLVLLLGMMILVAYLRMAGFFEWISVWILLKARTPGRLLWLVVVASGLLSALFVNDTICVLFTPILLGTVLRARLNPAPYLIALMTGANIGSAMTLTGNPQNMLVGLFSGIGYARFFAVLAPIAVACLVLDALIIGWLYRGRLGETFSTAGLELPKVDRVALTRVLAVLALVLAGFLMPLDRWLGLRPGQNLPFAAAAGAVLLILVARRAPAEAFQGVDWTLLLFFASLFVVVRGVSDTGVLAAAWGRLHPLFGSSDATQAAGLSGITVVLSNVVSNVPFVLVAKSWVAAMPARELSWFIVAMASTFAGNLTIVGSVANMIVMELSKDRAPVGFLEYLRVGVPVTLLTVGTGTGALLLLHRFGWI